MSKTIDQAEAALASANAAYRGELKRNIERPEGSGAQELRREERQKALKEDVVRCERDLKEVRSLNVKANVTALEKGQKVRHPSVKVEMKVMGPAGLGVVATSNDRITSDSVAGKTICEYTLNGKRFQKAFNTSELEPLAVE